MNNTFLQIPLSALLILTPTLTTSDKEAISTQREEAAQSKKSIKGFIDTHCEDIKSQQRKRCDAMCGGGGTDFELKGGICGIGSTCVCE